MAVDNHRKGVRYGSKHLSDFIGIRTTVTFPGVCRFGAPKDAFQHFFGKPITNFCDRTEILIPVFTCPDE